MDLAAGIYADQLVSKRLGHPLWQPEPTKYGEVLIGDVGVVKGGCFYRLFNATRPKDDPVNTICGVPTDFVTLQFNEAALLHTREDFLPPGPIHSISLSETSVGASLTT